MRAFIDIIRQLTEGIKDSPQFIESPNSSGQGNHPEHDQHPFHDVLTQQQYRYSHSTPIRKADGGYRVHHTYKHLDMRDNVVGISNNRWEAGKLGQARRTQGDTPEQLARYLKSHVKRSVKKLDQGEDTATNFSNFYSEATAELARRGIVGDLSPSYMRVLKQYQATGRTGVEAGKQLWKDIISDR